MNWVVALVRPKERVLLLVLLAMALIVAGGIVLLGAAQPAGAAPAAEEGKILFRSLSSTNELQTINPDGSGRSSFSPPIDGAVVDPQWSDDGTKFVYVDQSDLPSSGLGDIVISSADGTELERTNVSSDLPNNGFVRFPTLSPDGTKVAFTADDYGFDYCNEFGGCAHIQNSADIYTMNVDGSNLTQLDSDFSRAVWFNNLDWSPDGDKIALTGLDWIAYYFGSGPVEEIYTVKADGTGQPTHFADPVIGFQPSWSPDGSQIVYWREYDLHIMNADGSGKRDLTTNGRVVDERHASWSPKGNRLVFSGTWTKECPPFSANESFFDIDLFTINIDGSNVTNVTNTIPDCDDPAPPEYAQEWTPSWQPVFPTTDTTAPKVDVVKPPEDPAQGTTGAARGTNLTATFSERMDPHTISTSTFKLFKVNKNGTTSRITNAPVRLGADGLTARLNPFGSSDTLLNKSTKYKAVVTTGAKDLAGNALDQDDTTLGNQQKVWYFTTGTS